MVVVMLISALVLYLKDKGMFQIHTTHKNGNNKCCMVLGTFITLSETHYVHRNTHTIYTNHHLKV